MATTNVELLAVNEMFGPTWQGEGPSLGRRCAFLRLSGCNLECTWCDTPYTWDWTGKNGKRWDPGEQTRGLRIEQVARQLIAILDVDHFHPMIVVSGGEPLLQARRLYTLITHMRMTYPALHTWWEIETNGTIIPDIPSDAFNQYNVSPKLSHSGNALDKALNFDALYWFKTNGRSFFKFVVAEPSDLDEVDRIVKDIGIQKDRVYIMPEGKEVVQLMEHAALVRDDVLRRGYQMTTRLHILLWGDKRGV